MPYTYKDFAIKEDLLPDELKKRIPELTEKFNSAIAYLESDPVAAAKIQEVIDAKIPITFWREANGKTENKVHGLVTWNPDVMLIVNDLPTETAENNKVTNQPNTGKVLGVNSSASVLYHEFLHAIDPNYPQDQSKTYEGGESVADKGNSTRGSTTVNQRYGNVAEAYATAGERALAERMGETPRYNHAVRTWIATENPTQHTVKNQDGSFSWQARFARGQVTITGGEYNPSLDMQGQNLAVPDANNRNALKEIVNSTITVTQNAKDISLDGSGNTLNLSDGVSISTHGQFTVNYNGISKPTQGDNQIKTRDGKLEITPIEVNKTQLQSVSDKQSTKDGENKYHQLAITFEHAIKAPDPQDPHLIGLAKKHNELIGSIAFYNAASKELPEVTTAQIGHNLINEIKEGRPLQTDINEKTEVFKGPAAPV